MNIEKDHHKAAPAAAAFGLAELKKQNADYMKCEEF